ncbi:MAG: hypothetical protein FWG65_02110 [Turicibacter sp.]|nr:hypothetical protein [Turicibacter sp.]
MIVFDLRRALDEVPEGIFHGTDILKSLGEPKLTIINDRGVKTIRVSNRKTRENGIMISLPEMAKHYNLKANDRITVTGRIGIDAPDSNWGMEIMRGSADWYGQLAQQITPDRLFSMSYILEEGDLGHSLWVCSNHWGDDEPTMDFSVDSILVFRAAKYVEKDIRPILYKLSDDEYIQKFDDGMEIPLEERDSQKQNVGVYLRRSGTPVCFALKTERGNSISIKNRFNDWDGIDILLRPLKLKPGNQYKITIRGKIEGFVPSGATLILQGIPAYAWVDVLGVQSNESFELSCTLSQSNLEAWTACRIATNGIGGSLHIVLESIEIRTII